MKIIGDKIKLERADIVFLVAVLILILIAIWEVFAFHEPEIQKGEIVKSDTVRYFKETITKEKLTLQPVPYAVSDTVIKIETLDSVQRVQIALDYFKTRFYSDSLVNDTVKFIWSGNVFKNELHANKLNYHLRIPVVSVTNTKQAPFRPSLMLGAGPGYSNKQLTGTVYAGMDLKDYQIGASYDPFKNNTYIILTKKLSFKRKK